MSFSVGDLFGYSHCVMAGVMLGNKHPMPTGFNGVPNRKVYSCVEVFPYLGRLLTFDFQQAGGINIGFLWH